MAEKATFIRDITGFTGDAKLYRTTDQGHVVVSATVVPFGGGPETYIFPADENGKVTDWGELDGSYKGGLDHATALLNAGYEVVAGPM